MYTMLDYLIILNVGQKRSTGYKLFEDIAAEAGGQVMRTTTSEIETAVERVVKVLS